MGAPELRLHKGDDHRFNHRYYVEVDGVKVGWVLKGSDGWRFYATVHESIQGTLLASGNKTRRDALLEGLSTLRIRHLGRVYILNTSTWRDEVAYVEEDTLEALWARLLDEKYPLP